MSLVYSEKIALGWPAPDFELLSTSGEQVSLQDFRDVPVLVIVFSCNHCPYAKASWPILVELSQKYKDQAQFIAINSNNEEEYPDDDLEAMKELVIKEKVTFPYLRDADSQVAKLYQAVCTPDIFVFKNQGKGEFKLEYHGRINDNWQHPEMVTEHSLDMAIDYAINDQDPILDQHPSMGCSIKWS